MIVRPALRGLIAAFVLGLMASPDAAQLQLAVVSGTVLDESGLAMANSTIELTDPLGATISTTAVDSSGKFAFHGIAPGRYQVRVSLAGWEPVTRPFDVTSALPVELTLRVTLRTSISEEIIEDSGQPDSPSARASIAGDSIAQVPVRNLSRGVQEAVATLPGWATEDNGLLHVRGIDDGFLYVVDGVPVYERLDSLNGIGPDLANVESINVITGYIPAEFGYKAGGVIDVRSKSIGKGWLGAFQLEYGSDDATAASGLAGWRPAPTFAVTAAAQAQESNRFLDPIHPNNFHNRGNGGGAESQLTWQPSDSNFLSAGAAFGELNYDVPNTEAQAVASQDQRQHVTRDSATVSWQHAFSSSTWLQLAGYARRSTVTLAGSAFDTPVFADAHRTLARAGGIAGISRRIDAHTVKAGFEFQRVRIDESFVFAVTDQEAAEEAGLSEAAIEFGEQNPFSFAGHTAGPLWSMFLQDDWSATDRLTISAGVRFDENRLILVRRQLSPRVGAAYRAGTGTVLRGSVSRFFQPPQPENLLLSTSDEAGSCRPSPTPMQKAARISNRSVNGRSKPASTIGSARCSNSTPPSGAVRSSRWRIQTSSGGRRSSFRMPSRAGARLDSTFESKRRADDRGPAISIFPLAPCARTARSPAGFSSKTTSLKSRRARNSFPITISWWSRAAARPGRTCGPAPSCPRRSGMRAARRSRSAKRMKPSCASGQDQNWSTSIAAASRRGPSRRSLPTCRSGSAAGALQASALP